MPEVSASSFWKSPRTVRRIVRILPRLGRASASSFFDLFLLLIRFSPSTSARKLEIRIMPSLAQIVGDPTRKGKGDGFGFGGTDKDGERREDLAVDIPGLEDGQDLPGNTLDLRCLAPLKVERRKLKGDEGRVKADLLREEPRADLLEECGSAHGLPLCRRDPRFRPAQTKKIEPVTERLCEVAHRGEHFFRFAVPPLRSKEEEQVVLDTEAKTCRRLRISFLRGF